METGYSFPCEQKLTSCPCPESDESSSTLSFYFLKILLSPHIGLELAGNMLISAGLKKNSNIFYFFTLQFHFFHINILLIFDVHFLKRK